LKQNHLLRQRIGELNSHWSPALHPFCAGEQSKTLERIWLLMDSGVALDQRLPRYGLRVAASFLADQLPIASTITAHVSEKLGSGNAAYAHQNLHGFLLEALDPWRQGQLAEELAEPKRCVLDELDDIALSGDRHTALGCCIVLTLMSGVLLEWVQIAAEHQGIAWDEQEMDVHQKQAWALIDAVPNDDASARDEVFRGAQRTLNAIWRLLDSLYAALPHNAAANEATAAAQ
jgi:hypothetical protein